MSSYVESFIQALDAALGGGISTWALFPLDTLKTKLATAKDERMSVVSTLYQQEGIAGFYKGVTMKVSNSMLGKFLYFFYYNQLKAYYKKNVGQVRC